MSLDELENYVKLENGVIKQKNVNKIEYNYEYSNKYNDHGEKANYLSYLRLGVLLGNINKIPNSILDIGYGNGAFLNASKNIIKNCSGFDISGFPLPDDITIENSIYEKHFDVICFFDSLEHFDDINVIDKLKCDYVYISLPWCHYFSDEWFLNWYHRKPNEHLWHFNSESLIRFFEENGYKNIYLGNVEDTIRKNSTSNENPNILSAIFKKL
jgi:hypothetical protein